MDAISIVDMVGFATESPLASDRKRKEGEQKNHQKPTKSRPERIVTMKAKRKQNKAVLSKW